MTISDAIKHYQDRLVELRRLEARDALEAKQAALRRVWMSAQWDRALGESRH